MRLLFALVLLAWAGAAGAAPPSDFPGDPESGWVYAQKQCLECHPQTGSRSFRSIANQSGMTGMALVAWLTASEHRNMPHLVLKPEDARNVVAYILSLQDQPANK